MKHFYEKIDGWSSLNEQGELLKTILKEIKHDNLKIAEIGVYKGRCTSIWNVELINSGLNYQYYAIDHFKGSAEHNNDVDYYTLTKENIKPILNKVNLIKNDSISQSKEYEDEYFDIVYIDASHDYKSVKQDIIHWLPKVKTGGVMCGDDYTRGWSGVIKAVDEVFSKKINIVGKQQWWIKKQNS